MVSGRRELRWGGVSPSTPPSPLGDLKSQDSRPEKQEKGLRDATAETLCDFLPSLHSHYLWRLVNSMRQISSLSPYRELRSSGSGVLREGAWPRGKSLGGGRGLWSNGRGLPGLALGGGVRCVNDKKLHYQKAHPLQRSMAPASGWDIVRPGGVPFAALMLGLAKQSP